MKKDNLYPYGPIMTDGGDHITVFLDMDELTPEEIKKLDDGDDEFLLSRGGQTQALYIHERRIDHIELWNHNTKKVKNIPYEEYIARINGSANFKSVDFYVEKPFLPDKIKCIFNDVLGSEGWDGLIWRGEGYEYAAAIVDGRFFATYSIELRAVRV